MRAALRRDDRASARRIARRRFASPSIRRRSRRISATAGTSTRCARAMAACSSASATPKRPSISRGSPGCMPAGVICEILNDDGTTARRPQLEAFAQRARAHVHHRRAARRAPAADTSGWCIASPRRACRPSIGDVAHHRLPERRRHARARRARATATSATARTCSCACTPSASPATCSTRCAATAAGSSTRRWR